MLASSSSGTSVGGCGRAGRDSRPVVLEIEELAFELAVGRECLRIGIDQHVTVAAIDHDRVARLDLFQQATHARNGRNAAAAGNDGGVAGLAAALRHDRRHIGVAQRDDLRGQQLVGRDNQRTLEHRVVRVEHIGEMSAQSDHDVADVGEPFFEVLVLGAGKQRRVFVEQACRAACAVSRSSTIQLRILLRNAESRRIDSWTPKIAPSSGPTCWVTLRRRALRSVAVCRRPFRSGPARRRFRDRSAALCLG